MKEKTELEIVREIRKSEAHGVLVDFELLESRIVPQSSSLFVD